jgi:hypothetical protein
LAQLQSESEFFLNQINQIVSEHFGSIEPAIEKLTDAKYHYSQESEYWTEKLSLGVCSDLINYGTISKGVLEAIACLSDQQQQQILTNAVSKQISFHKLLDNTKDLALVSED